MQWFHLPIADVSVPDEQFEQRWDVAGNELRSMLRRRSDVVVHCRGGLGRAGTIAARLLVELGMEPTKAIASAGPEDPIASRSDSLRITFMPTVAGGPLVLRPISESTSAAVRFCATAEASMRRASVVLPESSPPMSRTT